MVGIENLAYSRGLRSNALSMRAYPQNSRIFLLTKSRNSRWGSDAQPPHLETRSKPRLDSTTAPQHHAKLRYRGVESRCGAVAVGRNGRRSARNIALLEGRRLPSSRPLHSRLRLYSRVAANRRSGRVEDGRGSLGHAATLRFPSPLIEPDVRISRIRLSD